MKWQRNSSEGVIAGCRCAVQVLALCGLLLLSATVSTTYAQLNRQKPENLQDVGIEERLGEQIPLDVRFATSEGDTVTIGELMAEGKPVLLNPVYYNCPMLCSMVTDAVYEGIRELKWTPGEEFTIITFSFDPGEDRALADSTRRVYMEKLGPETVEEGWHFLTGRKSQIEKLTEAVGFSFQKVEHNDEFAHSAAVMFLSPEGTLTRYLYGIKFDEFNIRNALYEAADGEIGSAVDKVVMYCYQYDPDANSYVPVAWRIMQLGGLVTVLILGIFLGLLWLKEKGSKHDSNPTDL